MGHIAVNSHVKRNQQLAKPQVTNSAKSVVLVPVMVEGY